jgi:hypothetical protein
MNLVIRHLGLLKRACTSLNVEDRTPLRRTSGGGHGLNGPVIDPSPSCTRTEVRQFATELRLQFVQGTAIFLSAFGPPRTI